ncbi:DUF5675 family protein [Flavobacterium tegetincola]|uniref:DUF5675 family protein n=1 Tax=Flavobacterium tegetincola TaxID=150172 RepID=UPI00047B2332|nr:DUF5675 family protein [Flavobacterium tegetincola]
MLLFLNRTYFPDGTNGQLHADGTFICYTIELPWKENEARISCIPEGIYFIRKRYSCKFQWHLEVVAVYNRQLILFHPANDALTELQGCIAPVCQLSGPGLGLMSRSAFSKLKTVVYAALERNEQVELRITSTL